MRLRKLVSEGERIPLGYGISYYDFTSEWKIAYPLFLHLVIHWVRDLWFWLLVVGRPGYRERIEGRYYWLGYARGTARGIMIRDW